MSNNISPLAYIEEGAQIGENVKIGPFCCVYNDTVIGDGTILENNVTIFPGARIGKNVHIFPGACIATVPQDLKFKGEYTTVEIGDGTKLHECVTVHRGTASKMVTKIGKNCMIMAYCHVAHDCNVGDNVIMSNSVQMAGEVVVDPFAVVGGGSLIHQFTHIGSFCMIQGGSGLVKDIPPYTMVGRSPAKWMGINTVGLRRHGYTTAQIINIQDIYRLVYASGYNTTHACEHIEAEIPQSPERDYILSFIRNSDRGIIAGNM
ncbi:MAG: acyl-ACP--UDP-N-acetylglucosamine O-acyltransferase [Bacteroidales bacterium]|nr:acyl-ACP--UDP-N-acetylglucosamine O-acyltransferase [Bacteroidales bacterium]